MNAMRFCMVGSKCGWILRLLESYPKAIPRSLCWQLIYYPANCCRDTTKKCAWPILILIFIADLPPTDARTIAVSADYTAVFSPHKDYHIVVSNLQSTVNEITSGYLGEKSKLRARNRSASTQHKGLAITYQQFLIGRSSLTSGMSGTWACT